MNNNESYMIKLGDKYLNIMANGEFVIDERWNAIKFSSIEIAMIYLREFKSQFYAGTIVKTYVVEGDINNLDGRYRYTYFNE